MTCRSMSPQDEVLRFLGKRKSAPTTKAILTNLSQKRYSDAAIEGALGQLVERGEIRCVNGLWVRRDRLMVDNRKPKGPKKIDPKSAEARTLALPLYDPGPK